MENLINCIGLKTEFPKSLFMRTYMYADSAEPKSFRILERSGICSFRLRAVFRHEASPKYCLIGCELNKREEQAFFEVLDELERDLLVMGYRDYEGYCDEVFRKMEKIMVSGKMSGAMRNEIRCELLPR